MCSKMIGEIKLTISLCFDNPITSQLLYDSLEIESHYNPNERAQAKLDINNMNLCLSIIAKDSVSARASVNSFFKWIELSLNILRDIVKN